MTCLSSRSKADTQTNETCKCANAIPCQGVEHVDRERREEGNRGSDRTRDHADAEDKAEEKCQLDVDGVVIADQLSV
jgi:hypothetical protein